ncbi:MarR family winged helix-turn-helix transcriptional regulator [Chryseolinea soli]|uniref:MarR family transcriptional regulator n=1 Tax=Chryseolinea soli TaxID=2321403 RepID=A0A385STI7_9BACT|nr:MarR family transcriptional regulator [Chryseolinea soli]AYB35163.1 MarR family transcriptional regulator [Chryseolinea soli]
MTPESLQTNIIFLCGDFAHVFHQAMTRAFRAHRIPVTIEQFSILAVLFYQNGINQKEIGTLLGRDKTTMTRIISNMVKNKLIRRITDKRDGRGKLIYLTGKGEAIQKKAVGVSGKLYLKVVKDIHEKELVQGMTLVSKMIKNVHASL